AETIPRQRKKLAHPINSVNLRIESCFVRKSQQRTARTELDLFKAICWVHRQYRLDDAVLACSKQIHAQDIR
ncbi:MAG TPA: hypothetical protein PLX26_03010, partial [Candidatus Competibacteraceae bacterium]|nr:hypothetical protein [Candidatus Competibacteraceae bacterium]